MKKIYFATALIVLGFLIPLSFYAIINTMVSLKYETDNGCISQVDGRDLCFEIRCWQAALLFSIIGIIALLIFRKKIIANKRNIG